MKKHYCDVIVRGKENNDFLRFLKLTLSEKPKEGKPMQYSHQGATFDLGDVTNIAYERKGLSKKPVLVETYAYDMKPVKEFYREWTDMQIHLYCPEVVEMAKLGNEIERVKYTKDKNKTKIIKDLETQIEGIRKKIQEQ